MMNMSWFDDTIQNSNTSGCHGMDVLVDEVSTVRVALSCHFALDSLCGKIDSC